MPTRKQRRRRQKELRHEYEYVYVDGEGREVEVDPAEEPSPRRNGKREAKAVPAKRRNSKPVREVSPPSWSKVLKRVAFIAPLLFLAFSALNHHQSLAGRLAITAIYTGLLRALHVPDGPRDVPLVPEAHRPGRAQAAQP